MKLKILGSGNIYSDSNSASYLIDDDILVDIPNGTCKELLKYNINPANIKNILLTHLHGDHYFDIPFMLLHKIKDDIKGAIIYTDNSGESKISALTKLAFPNKSKKLNNYFKFNTDKIFELESYEVHKIPLEHEEGIESYGYVFKNDKVKIGFTGDTCKCRSLTKLIKECTKVIIDCNVSGASKAHLNVANIEEIVKKFPGCIFYTTHMGKEAKEELEKLKFINLIVLNDGDEFNF